MTTSAPLYASTLGRIWLMIRLDYALYRWQVLRAIGLFALAAFVVPRIPLFFGEDLVNFSETYVRANMYDVHLAFGYVAVFFGWLAYCNRRTQHAKSIAFAHTPARLGEQIVCSFVFGLVLCVLMWLAVQLNQFVSWLTLPIDLPLRFDWLPDTDSQFIIYSGYVVHNPIVLTLINLGYIGLGFFTLVLGSISFRNIIKGWFIALAALAAGSFIVFSPQIYLSKLLLDSLVHQESSTGEITYVQTNALGYERMEVIFTTYLSILLPTLALVLGWLVYRKLKTIKK